MAEGELFSTIFSLFRSLGIAVILFPDNRDFACFAAVEQFVRLPGLFEAKAMGDHDIWMQVPAHQAFYQIFHLCQATDPRAVERKLFVEQQRTGFKGHRSSLTNKDDPAPYT